ncbi:MAG: glycosyltransferase family 9 protein [Bacteroidota bacterium]
MKILVLRFSSIGDIVLTSPVIRCMKQQIEGLEIHYLTKSKFKTILINNPNIDKLICFEKKTAEILSLLKAENYDYVIDLHNNIRTLKLKTQLNKKSFSFPKLNFKKWILVYLKKNLMPDKHIVERYFEAVKFFNVKNDLKPCDYFIPAEDEINMKQEFELNKYVAIALGAQYATKRLTKEKLIDIIEKMDIPLVLLGDKNDSILAEQLLKHFPEKVIFSACGKYNLNQSASIVKQAEVLLTHDTGLMHIASAFNKKIVSVWGNTVPELGMYPYMPQNQENYSIHQVENLSCRPCSKIGFKSCPKKHFNCMNLQNETKISEDVIQKYSSNTSLNIEL